MPSQNSLPEINVGNIKGQTASRIFGVNYNSLVGKVSPPMDMMDKIFNRETQRFNGKTFEEEVFNWFKTVFPTLNDREIMYIIYNFVETVAVMESIDENEGLMNKDIEEPNCDECELKDECEEKNKKDCKEDDDDVEEKV